jgi:hypothetical protein
MTPQKLLIPSDDNELTFSKIVGKEKHLEYTYTKSVTKLGTTLTISQEDVDKKIKNQIFKTI